MAKTEASKAPQKPEKPKYVPEGLRRSTGDVVGFHDLEEQGPIYGVPMGAKLSDSKIEPDKASCFIIFKLLEDKQLPDNGKCYEGSGDSQEEIMAKPGDMVGVWYKPGMKPVLQACGRKAFVAFSGEKRLKGRPEAQSPMKVYETHFSDGPNRLVPLIEDNRERSRNRKTPWTKEATGATPKPSREPGDDTDTEDYGF